MSEQKTSPPTYGGTRRRCIPADDVAPSLFIPDKHQPNQRRQTGASAP
jgi:hypothetical protein